MMMPLAMPCEMLWRTTRTSKCPFVNAQDKPGVFGMFVNVIVAALTALHNGLKAAGM